MLLNVRLGPEEDRVIRGLRRARVNVSALVRQALRDAGERIERRKASSPSQMLDELLTRFPLEADAKPKRPRLDDRREVQKFLRQRMRRR